MKNWINIFCLLDLPGWYNKIWKNTVFKSPIFSQLNYFSFLFLCTWIIILWQFINNFSMEGIKYWENNLHSLALAGTLVISWENDMPYLWQTDKTLHLVRLIIWTFYFGCSSDAMLKVIVNQLFMFRILWNGSLG